MPLTRQSGQALDSQTPQVFAEIGKGGIACQGSLQVDGQALRQEAVIVRRINVDHISCNKAPVFSRAPRKGISRKPLFPKWPGTKGSARLPALLT